MLYLFDVDNTLIHSYPGRPANGVAEVVFLPGVLDRCRALLTAGHALALVSNQGGIAWGKTTFIEVGDKLIYVCHQIGLEGICNHDYIFCPHSPDAPQRNPNTLFSLSVSCWCRKPSPWMLRYMMAKHDCWPDATCYVGDSDTDRMAAEAAGVAFRWAWEFFGWSEDFSTILEGVVDGFAR